MRRVIQEERTGCGIAAVAAIAEVSYQRAKRVGVSMAIHADDSRLWSDTGPVRRLLARFGIRVASVPRPFRSWNSLPDAALLAIKWHRAKGRAYWHWTVFMRDGGTAYVLDSKRSLKRHKRTDFGRMKPKWFLSVHSPARKIRQPAG